MVRVVNIVKVVRMVKIAWMVRKARVVSIQGGCYGLSCQHSQGDQDGQDG